MLPGRVGGGKIQIRALKEYCPDCWTSMCQADRDLPGKVNALDCHIRACNDEVISATISHCEPKEMLQAYSPWRGYEPD